MCIYVYCLLLFMDAHMWVRMTPVGFEPTQLALVELESTPLDNSGKVSMLLIHDVAALSGSLHIPWGHWRERERES